MTVPPDELATYKGGELCQYLDVFFAQVSGERLGSERVMREELFRAEDTEQLNRSDIYFAVHCMFERMQAIGGNDRTVRDLIATVRNALQEAASVRGPHARRTEATAVPPGTPGQDHSPGE